MSIPDDMWKTVGTTLITVVIAMAAFWLVEAREFVPRSEISRMINTESPYVKEQRLILSQLQQNSRSNQDLTEAVNALRLEIAEFRRRDRDQEHN